MIITKNNKKFKIKIIKDGDPSNPNNENIESKKDFTKLIELYIQSLDNFELQALEIAKRMLKSSFDIEKSIGFLEFLKSNNLN